MGKENKTATQPQDEAHESAIHAAIPGLLIKEGAASVAGIDQNKYRQPAIKPETLADKKSFFDQSHPDGTLSADWRAVTTFASPLVPKGGTVVDLGGNSGQYGKFLALSRPDVKVISIESDPDKYKMAQDEIHRLHLEGRITLMRGPVPEALDKIAASGQKIDAVTSVYRTNIQTDAQNATDMAALGRFNQKTGASILMHDLHRPQLKSTLATMIEVYPAPDSTQEFRNGYRDAMMGAYRDDEMRRMLQQHVGGKWQDMPAMPMAPAQVQMHILPGTHVPPAGTTPEPNYPPTKAEYIKVAEGMAGLIQAGGMKERATAGVKVLSSPPTSSFNEIAAGHIDQPKISMPLALRRPLYAGQDTLPKAAAPVTQQPAEPPPRKMAGNTPQP